ncbi:uncharacterized protein Tco025E_02227 [Trypanosoma conorhini]|uniref:Uncharacterized protein n=1 Tax=Trypanosoma conorhini TaxID=83891 RepID=A0A422Q5W7_9TRYP|nr:uncharacterized protein Tco025E_02227 [Trypanosoma conorhini]RNF25344.1 hypothetical protein Tco025E_02227 [Trypanosoma conorhini]
MSLDREDQTLSARLCALPATEHAILLNRFKFLDLVQRVAAADVAEMVQTIGLEALSYKGALETIPTMRAAAAGVTSPASIERPTRRGSLPPQRGHAQDASAAPETVSRQRRRFQTREKELQFVNRLSQPQTHRDALDFQLRKPPRGRQDEGLVYTRTKSPSPHRSGRYDGAAAAAAGELRQRKGARGRHGPSDNDNDNDNNNDDDDDVVIDSSDDRWALGGGSPKVRFASDVRSLPLSTPQQAFEQPAREPGFRDASPVARRRSIPPGTEGNFPTAEAEGAANVGGGERTRRQLEATSPVEQQQQQHQQQQQQQQRRQQPQQQTDTSLNPLTEIATPRTTQSSATRYRGHLAPKAKPKAAADVPRVPMEVIRHASALLMGRGVAHAPGHIPSPSAGAVDPQQPPHASTQSASWDAQTPHFPSGTSQSLLQSSSARRGVRRGELETQTGQTPILAMQRALSDEAIAELASAVERMLQDHRAVLDGIMKDKESLPSEAATPTRKKEKGLHGASTEVGGDGVGGSASRIKGKPAAPRAAPTADESARIVQQAHDALEDISDEEDELLLVSRLQRQVGAMDRELEVIEQRERQRYGVSGEGREGHEEDEGERFLRPTESTRRDGRRVVIDEPNRTPSGAAAKRGRGRRHRRRGEIPRAIVERLRSFQKENLEYVRYTEKQWNTSHVTEQVFAQRLTEALAEDAFQEVLQEVGGILDTYVEGLVLHELQ